MARSKNQDVGMPAVAVRPGPEKPPVRTHISGKSLVPDLDDLRSNAGISLQYRYWVGITPSCPVESIDIAGINFPKINENLVEDPMRTGIKRRVPVIGSIVYLTEDKIRRIRERLARTVIRFTEDPGEQDEPGTGQNLGDAHRRARRGQVITIPTSQEVVERRKAGKATRQYVPGPNDVPAARFLFAQLCADQVNGSRGDVYPETLETTGLEWPDDIEGIPSTRQEPQEPESAPIAAMTDVPPTEAKRKRGRPAKFIQQADPTTTIPAEDQ